MTKPEGKLSERLHATQKNREGKLNSSPEPACPPQESRPTISAVNVQENDERRDLSDSDVVFRSLTYLVVMLLLAVIAYLLVQSGIPELGKQSSLTDWFLVLLTLAYAVVSYRTLRAIHDQTLLSRNTARRQLRAYIVVKSVRVEVDSPDGAPKGTTRVIPGVTFFNAGQTPAYRLSHFQSMHIDSLHLRPVFPEAANPAWRTIAVLGPRVEHPNNLRVATNLTSEQTALLQRGDLYVYFWGEIRYRDIFGAARRTPFAFRWPRIPGAWSDPDLIACEDGNDPDD